LREVGFTDDELGEMGNEALLDENMLDEVPAKLEDAITKPGDLWLLGNHRLLCGDSSKPEDVDRLLDGAKIHLVNTDPPYNVNVAPRSNNAVNAALASGNLIGQQGMDVANHPQMFVRGRNMTKMRKNAKSAPKVLRAKDRPLANDFLDDEAFSKLLLSWFGNITRVLEPGRSFYIWGGYSNIYNYPNALKACELYFSQMIIWVKEHPVLTRKDFMGNHEWCQPPGTLVRTPHGDVPIENLRDSDRVVSFSRSSSAVVGHKHGLGIRTTSRHYEGELFGVTAGTAKTWTTDGHPWSVKLVPEADKLWCVYLMRRGSWWRVGKSKLLSTWGFGLKHRMFSEGGEEGWILSVHNSNVEATTAEQIVSVKYGIPTTFWREYPNSQRTKEGIAAIYDRLDLNILNNGALRALNDYHKRLAYPFITHGETRPKYGCRIPLTVAACNLLPGAMAVPIPGDKASFHWEPIRPVDIKSYSGPVYSMDVEKHHHYIADGIVTHNCFYGWREGAGHKFYGPNNATDVWSVKKVNPQSMIHLTEKPVELAVRAINYSSLKGENVLDLFGGSGSTLIACEHTARKAFVMEMDALYCDVIVKRWEQATGKKAEVKHAS